MVTSRTLISVAIGTKSVDTLRDSQARRLGLPPFTREHEVERLPAPNLRVHWLPPASLEFTEGRETEGRTL